MIMKVTTFHNNSISRSELGAGLETLLHYFGQDWASASARDWALYTSVSERRSNYSLESEKEERIAENGLLHLCVTFPP